MWTLHNQIISLNQASGNSKKSKSGIKKRKKRKKKCGASDVKSIKFNLNRADINIFFLLLCSRIYSSTSRFWLEHKSPVQWLAWLTSLNCCNWAFNKYLHSNMPQGLPFPEIWELWKALLYTHRTHALWDTM